MGIIPACVTIMAPGINMEIRGYDKREYYN
jgi:hypothetical protein